MGLIRCFPRNMVLKCISILILFFTYNYLEIAKSKYDIQIDFDIQLDVPNHGQNVRSNMSHYKSHSSVNQQLVSRNGFGQRYKVHKAKSRSLTGTPNDVTKCCQEKGVADYCFGYCSTGSKNAASRAITGACKNWLKEISDCEKGHTFPVPKLQNVGHYCWLQCNKVNGRCLFCGSEGLCCRKGWPGNECDGKIGLSPDHHRCSPRPGLQLPGSPTHPLPIPAPIPGCGDYPETVADDIGKEVLGTIGNVDTYTSCRTICQRAYPDFEFYHKFVNYESCECSKMVPGFRIKTKPHYAYTFGYAAACK